MVGNDVVDLRDPDTQPGATHPRFDERAFSAAERYAIAASATPNHLRWLLWAAKESAFKLLRKRHATLVFAPTGFAVRLDNEFSRGEGATVRGTVLHANGRVSFRAVADYEVVHVIATDEQSGDGAVLAAVQQIASECPSAAVRQLAIARLAPYLGVAPAELAIVRAHRVPRLQLRGEWVPIDVSLSHHGRFIAFASVYAPLTLILSPRERNPKGDAPVRFGDSRGPAGR